MDALMKTIAFFLLLAITLPSTEARQPVLHRVGGGQYSWQPETNFTNWASHESFYVGDWLYFGYNKQKFRVLEVNKTSYENCNDTNIIKNITRGGRDVFNLTTEGNYYFISNRFYCLRGMKLEIYVAPVQVLLPRKTPLPAFISKPRSRAEGSCLSRLGLGVLLASAALAWIVI